MIRRKYLENLTEQQLFVLMKIIHPDIIDLNVQSTTSTLDWYVPSLDLYYEAKCRKYDGSTVFIQKDKWDELRKKNNARYINSTPSGIYWWDITNMEEPVFHPSSMKKSQEFAGKNEYVKKEVGDLRKTKSQQIDQILLKDFLY